MTRDWEAPGISRFTLPDFVPPQRRVVMLIAGSVRQVDDYCLAKRLNPHDYLTPFATDELAGARPDEVRLIGTFHDNPAHMEARLRWEDKITYDNY